MRLSVLCIILLVFLSACSGGENQSATPTGAGEQTEEELPAIIPYLDCRPSAADGLGQAGVSPKGPFPAGSRADFEIVFTVGEGGVAPGGFVILQIPPWWGWTQPQDYSAEADGYMTVKPSFEDPGLRVNILRLNRVLVYTRSRRMAPGDTLTFLYRQARVDRFAEAGAFFRVFIDADGDGHSAGIAHPPSVQILPRQAVRMNVTAPSRVNPGQAVHVSAAPLDRVGNWSQCPPGVFTLTVTGDGKTIMEKQITAAGGEKKLEFSVTLPREGIYFCRVRGPSGLAGKSNVILCQKGAPYLNLYFGDIHGHSGLTDGTGTPRDYYLYARDVSRLDIAALTDHADHGVIPIDETVWKHIKDTANNLYVPHRFVTYTAFEWTNWEYGHRNVYYRDGNGPIFRAFDPHSNTPQKLWELIASYEVMTVAHHVGGGPIATNWDIPPGPKEWLVEIASVHGSSEYYGGEAGIYRPKEGHFVRDALGRGYKLGIIASGDTHDGHPGQRSMNAPITGILGVYASELTRESVWEAFKQRRVYGTSGPKIILNFRVCDSPMGSEVNWPVSKGKVPILFRAVCCDEIDRIEIIRNGVVVFSEPGDGVFAQLMIEDPEPLTGESWYYARVIQKDGNMAWTSPLWINMSKNLNSRSLILWPTKHTKRHEKGNL